jgi:predicted PolB exonuclease-like 3'-5' exonuclease
VLALLIGPEGKPGLLGPEGKSAFDLAAPLDDIAKLCGFPGKLGMDGGKVWDTYRQGDIQSIRDYCETDVANTYLVYLKFQLIRGHLNQNEYESEINLIKNTIQEYQKDYWDEFLSAWKS